MAQKEKDYKSYEDLNHSIINRKLANCSTEVLKCAGKPDADKHLFHFVKEKLSQDELVYIACIHIRLNVREALKKDPILRQLASMLQELKNLDTEENS